MDMNALVASATATLLAVAWKVIGALVLWLAGLDTAFGKSLTIGALCAIAALAVGVLVTRPGVLRMLSLGRQIAETGGPPSPEIGAELGAIQQRLKVAARISFALLVVAVVLMSTGRYL